MISKPTKALVAGLLFSEQVTVTVKTKPILLASIIFIDTAPLTESIESSDAPSEPVFGERAVLDIV